MAPVKIFKSGVISIGCDPFASGFDRQGGQVGVGYHISLSPGLTAEALKNFPVTVTASDVNAVGAFSQLGRKCKGFIKRAWFVKYARMGDDTKKTAQNQV